MADAHHKGPTFPRWLLTLAAVIGVGYLLYLLRGALTPVFFAFLIAYMLDPVVDRFEERGMSRAAGIAVMTTLVVIVLLGLVFLVVPGIIRETYTFVEQLPATFTNLLDRAEPLLEEIGVEVPSSFDDVRSQLAGVDTSALAEKAGTQLMVVASFLLGGTVNILAAMAGFIMIPVFAAYLLYDFDRMTAAIRDLVPGRYRAYVVEVAGDVDAILGEFIRGQLLVMLALVVLYAVGYSIVGVPLAIAIGVVAGLLSFIPYVGGALALGMALLMSFLHWNGWNQIIGIGVVYGVIQLLESFLITPKIVGDKVGLPAVWVLFALLVGGELFGFMGVLLALPAAAVAKIFVVRGVAWYRASDLYRVGTREESKTGAAATEAAAAPSVVPPPVVEESHVGPPAVTESEGADVSHLGSKVPAAETASEPEPESEPELELEPEPDDAPGAGGIDDSHEVPPLPPVDGSERRRVFKPLPKPED